MCVSCTHHYTCKQPPTTRAQRCCVKSKPVSVAPCNRRANTNAELMGEVVWLGRTTITCKRDIDVVHGSSLSIGNACYSCTDARHAYDTRGARSRVTPHSACLPTPDCKQQGSCNNNTHLQDTCARTCDAHRAQRRQCTTTGPTHNAGNHEQPQHGTSTP